MKHLSLESVHLHDNVEECTRKTNSFTWNKTFYFPSSGTLCVRYVAERTCGRHHSHVIKSAASYMDRAVSNVSYLMPCGSLGRCSFGAGKRGCMALLGKLKSYLDFNETDMVELSLMSTPTTCDHCGSHQTVCLDLVYLSHFLVVIP